MERPQDPHEPRGLLDPSEPGDPSLAADVHQLVIEPGGPLPPVPRSPLLDYALFLCFLAPFIGWQTGHLIWGVVAMPILFVLLAYFGGRHLLGRIHRVCAQLVAEGRPLDVVPFLYQCHAANPKNPAILALLDRAAHELVTARGLAEASQDAAPTAGVGGPPGTTYELLAADTGPDLPPAPVDKVASGAALAVWILASFAFVPFLGVLPAVALVVLGILLLASPTRLLDRKVGVAALVIAALSIGVAVVTLVQAVGEHFTAPPDLSLTVKSVPWTVTAVSLVVLIASIVLHECAHGLAAWWAGDTTARDEGRLTLNPLPHVDLFGSIILPAIMAFVPGGLIFGWAKPVPVDPQRYRRARLGNIGVSLAGVSVNMFLAALCAAALVALGVGLRAAYPSLTVDGFGQPFQATHFSGIPMPGFFALAVDALKAGVLINALLANLNALPIPPLDGFHVLLSILPESWAAKLGKINAYGFMIFLALLFFRVIDYLLLPGLLVAIALIGFAASASAMW